MKRDFGISIASVGCIFMCVYIFFGFNAHDIVFPTILAPLSMYAFLGWGVLTVLSTKKIKLSVYTIWYLVFMGWSLITMLYSQENRLMDGEFYLMIVSFIVSFLIQLYVKNSSVFKMLAWSFAVASLVLVVSLYSTGNLVADANNRLGGDIMGNSNTFALMMMCATMFEIWLLIYGKYNKLTNLLIFAMILINYYALVLSAGRKFFVMPVVFLYILLIYKRDRKGRTHFIKYTVFIMALAYLMMWLIMNVDVFYETIGYRMESLINGTLGVSEQGSSAAIRETMRELATEKWLKSPVIGYGFDSFKFLADAELGHFFYSHCNYTELLYNGGIIYFIIYYWIYYRLFRETVILKKGSQEYRAFAIGTLVCFLIFDYGAVSYSISFIQLMLAISFGALNFEDRTKNVGLGV